MKLNFEALITTPSKPVSQPFINCAVFRTPDGNTYVIDRRSTEYTFAGNRLFMTWNDVFVWDGKSEIYLPSGSSWAEDVLLGFVIEDDVPEGYYVVPTFCCTGSGTNVLMAGNNCAAELSTLIVVADILTMFQKSQHSDMWSVTVWDNAGVQRLGTFSPQGWKGQDIVKTLPVASILPSYESIHIKVFDPIDEDGKLYGVKPLTDYWEEVQI